MSIPKSKIANQITFVSEAPFRIAPERQRELTEILSNMKIFLKVKDDHNVFDFSASRMIRAIFSTIRSFEYLWANAYFNLVIYDWYVSNPKGTIIEFDAIPEMGRARDLLLWADKALEDPNAMWPDHLPSPESPPEENDYIVRANQIFLAMCGFILLHEVAHIVNNHEVDQETPIEVRKKYEYEADKWAYDWILAKWEDFSKDPLVFTLRTLGVASALVSIAHLELNNQSENREHPALTRRLIAFCADYFPNADGSDVTSAGLTLIPLVMHAHIYRSGISLDPAAQYSTVFDYLENMDKYFH